VTAWRGLELNFFDSGREEPMPERQAIWLMSRPLAPFAPNGPDVSICRRILRRDWV
jgi:hypothetical protein